MKSKQVIKLEKGCGKQLARKKWVIRNYKGPEDAHFKCGSKHPKKWGKNDLRVKHDRFYCSSCKMKIGRQLARERLNFLEEFYKNNG